MLHVFIVQIALWIVRMELVIRSVVVANVKMVFGVQIVMLVSLILYIRKYLLHQWPHYIIFCLSGFTHIDHEPFFVESCIVTLCMKWKFLNMHITLGRYDKHAQKCSVCLANNAYSTSNNCISTVFFQAITEACFNFKHTSSLTRCQL